MRMRNKPELEEVMKEHPKVKYKPEKRINWNGFFKNDNPLFLEIGTGRGSFLANLADENPGINFIGLDKVKEVLIKAVGKIEERKLTNVGFICGYAERLTEYFKPGEISRIYLNFSDPWPKNKHRKRRLTHENYIEKYHYLLQEKGEIHMKTDSFDFFKFSLEKLSQNGFLLRNITFDLHHSKFNKTNIITEYEEKWLAKGKGIFRLEAIKERGGIDG